MIAAVASVTKGSEVARGGYEQSIRRAMKDPIGLWVQAADVADNAGRLVGNWLPRTGRPFVN